MKLPDRRSEQGLYAMIAGAALVVIYLVAFVVSNSRAVAVSFVLFSGTASLIIVMLFSILLGVVIGVVLGRVIERTRGRRAARDTSTSTGRYES